jgi:hypothetical protein
MCRLDIDKYKGMCPECEAQEILTVKRKVCWEIALQCFIGIDTYRRPECDPNDLECFEVYEDITPEIVPRLLEECDRCASISQAIPEDPFAEDPEMMEMEAQHRARRALVTAEELQRREERGRLEREWEDSMREQAQYVQAFEECQRQEESVHHHLVMIDAASEIHSRPRNAYEGAEERRWDEFARHDGIRYKLKHVVYTDPSIDSEHVQQRVARQKTMARRRAEDIPDWVEATPEETDLNPQQEPLGVGEWVSATAKRIKRGEEICAPLRPKMGEYNRLMKEKGLPEPHWLIKFQRQFEVGEDYTRDLTKGEEFVEFVESRKWPQSTNNRNYDNSYIEGWRCREGEYEAFEEELQEKYRRNGSGTYESLRGDGEHDDEDEGEDEERHEESHPDEEEEDYREDEG